MTGDCRKYQIFGTKRNYSQNADHWAQSLHCVNSILFIFAYATRWMRLNRFGKATWALCTCTYILNVCRKMKNEYRKSAIGIVIICASVFSMCIFSISNYLFILCYSFNCSALSFSILSYCDSLFFSAIQPFSHSFIHFSVSYQRIEYIMYKLTS